MNQENYKKSLANFKRLDGLIEFSGAIGQT